jgi:hypothetical protein
MTADGDRKPICEPEEKRAGVTDLFQKIKKERNRSLFVFAAEDIDDNDAEQVYGWRKELREAGKEGQLDVLIHSPGGNLSSCYVIARLFSRCVNSWEALVPKMAASGATLISLGSSNIVMSEMAQLGPLDPQVISRRREKFFDLERQSPLEAFAAVRYLRTFSLEALDGAMSFLRKRRITPHLALETATKLATQLAQPVLNQIEPYDLGAFALDSRVAVDYCKRISDPTDKAKKTQRDVQPEILVETYPTHEFIIDCEEAKALNFSVSEPTPEVDELFDQLRPRLDELTRYIGLIS